MLPWDGRCGSEMDRTMAMSATDAVRCGQREAGGDDDLGRRGEIRNVDQCNAVFKD